MKLITQARLINILVLKQKKFSFCVFIKCLQRSCIVQASASGFYNLPFPSHDVRIGDGVGDSDVSVHGDDDEMKNAGGAGPHVNREPDEAEVSTKDPGVQYLIHRWQGQHQHSQQEVSQGQGDYEGVGGTRELGGGLDGEDDQDVAEGDDETDETKRHQGTDNLQHFRMKIYKFQHQTSILNMNGWNSFLTSSVQLMI